MAMIVLLQGVQTGIAARILWGLIESTLAGQWVVPTPASVLLCVVVGIVYMSVWGFLTWMWQGIASLGSQ
jgi:hypothetical protein